MQTVELEQRLARMLYMLENTAHFQHLQERDINLTVGIQEVLMAHWLKIQQKLQKIITIHCMHIGHRFDIHLYYHLIQMAEQEL